MNPCGRACEIEGQQRSCLERILASQVVAALLRPVPMVNLLPQVQKQDHLSLSTHPSAAMNGYEMINMEAQNSILKSQQ